MSSPSATMPSPIDSGQVALLGRTLKRLRKERGLSTDDLSRRVGLQAGDLARMEKGRSRIGLDTLVRIARELGIGVRDLLQVAPEATTAPPSRGDRSEIEIEEFVAFRRPPG